MYRNFEQALIILIREINYSNYSNSFQKNKPLKAIR